MWQNYERLIDLHGMELVYLFFLWGAIERSKGKTGKKMGWN